MKEINWSNIKYAVIWIGIGMLFFKALHIWEAVLDEPLVSVNIQYPHEWAIAGHKWQADHITTTLPNYMGTRGFTIEGWDAGNQKLWQVESQTSYKQIR